MNYTNDLELDDTLDLNLDWDSTFNNDSKVETTPNFSVNSISDGLIYSLRNLGKVDIYYISKITGATLGDVVKRLAGSIFLDPDLFDGDIYQGYKTSDEYLSGNLLTKLKKAQEYNKKYNGLFDNNIKSLKEVMPEGIKADGIYFNLSSPWIPKEILVTFFKNTFVENPDNQEYLYLNEATNLWSVKVINKRILASANMRYGTNRISGVKIFENLINAKEIVLYRSYGSGDRRVTEINESETIAANEKADELNSAFINYVKSHDELYKLLADSYNEKYGFVVARIFNGDFLDFPKMNSKVTLFKSQVDAIARIIFNRNTLLAYNVGAGKTFIMISSGEELLRIGLSTKNLYVVPNSIVSQWKQDYEYLYPNSKVLTTTSKDYNPSNINKTLSLIKNGDYKAIIMPQSSFDRIEMSKSFELDYLNRSLNKLLSIPENERSRGVKIKIDAINKKIDGLNITNSTQIPFDDLGITRLYIDEAHNYKNIPLSSVRGFIRGVNLEGSVKCEHMKKVCDYLNRYENTGIIMATGTPISNSISDIYSIQLYLQEGELNLFDIKSFDDWLSMFSETTTEVELDIDANRYRAVKRLAKFHNLPELANILSSIAAFHYDYNSDNLPKLDGYNNIKINKSIEFKHYIDVLSKRLTDIRNHIVRYKDDNLLKVTNDGRRAALDLRLIDENIYANYSADKIVQCALKILEIYHETDSFKGTQLVFCDISVPSPTFNVYDDLKARLIKLGINPNEIEYIHNAKTEKKREALFKAMREGKIRVLIGSTPLLGLGVNIQDNLYALHHLDIPWRPADMVQREGRILRIGNKNQQVYIYRYITEGSFDAYSWQILETKQRFINELLSNSISERNKEDIQDAVLSYGEAKALAIGNPLIKERAEVKNELEKLKLLHKKYTDTKARYKRELMEIPVRLKDIDEYVAKLDQDLINYNSNYVEYNQSERLEIGKEIWNALLDNIGGGSEKQITNYKGFVVIAPEALIENNFYLYLENQNRYHVLLGTSELGITTRMDNVLEKLPKFKEDYLKEKEDLVEKQKGIEYDLANMEDYTDKISELNQRLIMLDKELKKNE